MRKILALILTLILLCTLISCTSEEKLRGQIEAELRQSIESELRPVIRNEIYTEVEQEIFDEQKAELEQKIQNGYSFYEVKGTSTGGHRCLGIYDSYDEFHNAYPDIAFNEQHFEKNYAMVVAYGRLDNYQKQSYNNFKIEYDDNGAPIGYSIEYYAQFEQTGLGSTRVPMHIVLIPKTDISLPYGIDAGKTKIHEVIDVVKYKGGEPIQ